MPDTDAWGRLVHKEPETFRDRVAWALAAHDIGGGEGRVNDDELAELDALIQVAIQVHGPSAARQKFGKLYAFARMERALRDRDGKHLAHAHVIAADWPSYLGSADAAIGVMLERPEAVAQIVNPKS